MWFPKLTKIVFAISILYIPLHAQVQFQDVTQGSGLDNYYELGWGTAMLDYDRDNDVDIFVLGHYGQNRMYRNEGGFSFADVTAPLCIQGFGDCWGVCYADFDSDNDEDIYISRRDGLKSDFFVFNGTNYVESSDIFGVSNDGGYSHAACFAPLSKNPTLDLLITNQAWPIGRYQSLKLFSSNIDIPFTDLTQSSGLADSSHLWQGVGCADYDNDNDLDIFIASEPTNTLFRNEHGVFYDVSYPAGFVYPFDIDTTGMAAAWGDYNNDGWLDLYVTPWRVNQHGKLYRNNGDGTFSEIANSAGVGIEEWGTNASFGDFDNDGWLDIFVVSGSYGAHLYMNNHDETFADRANAAGIIEDGWCGGSSIGDLDSDGRLDIVLSHYAYLYDVPNKTSLYRNVTANQNNWVIVKVNGMDPNPDAIGARVRIVAGGISQIREVSGGAGFGCQNMLPLHFGLGSAATIDSLIITFPDHQAPSYVYTNLEANRYIYLPELEPEGTVDEEIIPSAIVLNQNYPNPFNSETIISFTLGERSRVNLDVFDIAGRIVMTPYTDILSAGYHEIKLELRDPASGVYFYRLATGHQAVKRSMIMIK